MNPDRNEIREIVDTIKKCKTFFIAGHLKPDGDTIGTSLALASLLRRLGKTPYIYSKEPVPETLRFLPGSNRIIIKNKALILFIKISKKLILI